MYINQFFKLTFILFMIFISSCNANKITKEIAAESLITYHPLRIDVGFLMAGGCDFLRSWYESSEQHLATEKLQEHSEKFQEHRKKLIASILEDLPIQSSTQNKTLENKEKAQQPLSEGSLKKSIFHHDALRFNAMNFFLSILTDYNLPIKFGFFGMASFGFINFKNVKLVFGATEFLAFCGQIRFHINKISTSIILGRCYFNYGAPNSILGFCGMLILSGNLSQKIEVFGGIRFARGYFQGSSSDCLFYLPKLAKESPDFSSKVRAREPFMLSVLFGATIRVL